MNLSDLERMIRLAVVGESRPTLATVADNGALNEALDDEFADAIRTLSSRARKPGTKPDDPTLWI